MTVLQLISPALQATQHNLRGFKVVLDGVTLRDWSWLGDGRGYFPVSRGLEVEVSPSKSTLPQHNRPAVVLAAMCKHE